MDVTYSIETIRLARQSFHRRHNRYPSDEELTEYVDSLLKFGLAVIS